MQPCGHLLIWVSICTGGLVASQKPSMSATRHDVYIAGFFPFSAVFSEKSETGRGVLPAARLAVDHINENPSILRNYRLHMWWNDTQCDAAVGVKAFFDMLHHEPHKVMLFGGTCTHVTDPIAKASKYWHLTQVSYADTHPMFTSSKFPNFFRVVPSENAFNAPRLKLLQHFNWTRVGTIYQNEPRYSLAHNRLVAELDASNLTIVETQSLTTNVSVAIKKLKEKDIRIILGNFNETWARRIFCEAHRVGIVGRKYQWLIMGTYSAGWWNVNIGPCGKEELVEALEGCILTDYLPLASTKVITISGRTPSEYESEYNIRRDEDYSRFHGYTYDGIWASALAIQHVAHRIRLFRRNTTIIDFRYRDELWEQLFLEALRNTSFEGVTGPVRFYDNERKGTILLKQFQDGAEVKIGEYNGLTEKLDISNDAPIVWKDNRGPPKDRTLHIFVHSSVNFAVYSILVVLSIIGILAATIFLIINIRYRNQRYIKMSSPYLNNLIIIGCMLTYISVIFLGLDSSLTSEQTFPYICAARAWLLMAGFSLAFGAMFSKTWRVHSIFTNVKLNKKVIKDYQLFMVVGVLLAIDLGIMTTWQVADPFYRETKLMEPFLDPSSDDIHIIPVNEYCQSNKMTWFVGLIYAYKGLLMIFGAFLAWETRHVSIPALNDSKYVGMSTYNVVLMCVMGAAVSFVLSDQQNYSFAIISVFILFCSTITLCLVFVPKVVELRRNPQGSIDKRIRATLRPMSKPSRESSEIEEQVKDAKATNQQYRKILQERDTELQLIMRKLSTAEDFIPLVSVNRNQQNNLTRKEAPSHTETTELSSVCSVLSIVEADPTTTTLINTQSNSQQRKKTTTFASDKIPSISVEDRRSGRSTENDLRKESSQLSVISTASLSPTCRDKLVSSSCSLETSAAVAAKKISSSTVPTRKKSNSVTPVVTAVDTTEDCDNVRRTSITKRSSPAFVHQDELWLTQRQCKPRCLLNDNTPPSEEDDEVSTIHRSVSERSHHDKCNHHHRHHHHHHHHHGHAHHHHQASSISNGNTSLKKPAPVHMQSTPNVLGSTVSENELLDLAILPIFQKLLTDRRGAAIASCPNIAIKCDIVEYL